MFYKINAKIYYKNSLYTIMSLYLKIIFRGLNKKTLFA